MNPLDFNYKKLRVAQDLNKRTLEAIGMKLLKKDENGIFKIPDEATIAKYINDLASEKKIKHYILKGEYEDIVLFDNDEVISELNIIEVERQRIELNKSKVTEIVKIQCYDKPVTYNDNVPFEISRIDNLYKIPETLFNSGTCIYFLCHDNKVVYVGQAENIHSRLVEHHKAKYFDAVFYIRVSANRMSKVESSLIAYLQPKYNKTALKLDNQKQSIAQSVLCESVKIQNTL